jgi:hypothetical protein
MVIRGGYKYIMKARKPNEMSEAEINRLDAHIKKITQNIDELTKGLNAFKRLKIKVLENKNVRFDNNNKTEYNPKGTDWANPNIKRTHQDNITALNGGCCGFMIQTGEYNNISVIDWDDHEKQTTNKINLLERLKATGTFTIKTPTGEGFHFYFKYIPSIGNKVGIFNNVDIRNNKALVYYGQRDDGQYTPINHNADILEIPNDILRDILEEIKKDKTTKTETKIIKSIHSDKEHIAEEIESFRYDTTSEDVKYILSLLPREQATNGNKWLIITSILHRFNYNKEWDEWSKTATTEYNKINNMRIWGNLKITNETPDLSYIYNIINEVDHTLKTPNKIYCEYEILTPDNRAKITSEINVKYLDGAPAPVSIYSGGDIIIRSGQNTGKTTSNIKYCLDNDLLYFSICPLKSIANSQYNSFKDAGIKCVYYEDFKKNKDDPEISTSSVFTTIDSILDYKHLDFKDRTIFLDEVHSLIKYILSCENIGGRRLPIISFLLKIMRECKQIIAVDGDICNNTIALLELIKPHRAMPYRFINNIYKSYSGIDVVLMNEYDEMINKMKQDILENKYFLCCCNTKTQTNILNITLQEAGIKPTDILIYTSEEGEQIQDIKTEWTNKYIIYSPSIVAGLDFTPTTAQNVYCFISSTNTIDPEQSVQQITRNRNINKVYLYTERIGNTLEYKTLEDARTAHNKTLNEINANRIYRELCNKVFNDEIGDWEYKDNSINKMYIRYIYDQNILKSSLDYNICEILKSKGFNVIGNNKNIKVITQDAEEKEEIKDEIEYIRNDLYEAFINNSSTNKKFNNTITQRLEILDIIKPTNEDDEGIREYQNILLTYKTIILEDYDFRTHLNIRALITDNKTIDAKMQEKFKNDLVLKAFKGRDNMIKQYKHIMNKYLPEISLYRFTYKHDDKYLTDPIILDDDDLTFLKSVIPTTKKNINISTKYDLLKTYMNAYAKTIYGGYIITTKETKQRTGARVKTYTTRDFNNELFKQHIDLHKIYLSTSPDKLLFIDKVIINEYYNDIMQLCPKDKAGFIKD